MHVLFQEKVSSDSESIQARAEAVMLLKQLDFPVGNSDFSMRALSISNMLIDRMKT